MYQEGYVENEMLLGEGHKKILNYNTSSANDKGI